MNYVAIDYVPPNRDRQGRIVGIDVAVRTMLEAYCRYSQAEIFFCRTQDRYTYDTFLDLMGTVGVDPSRCRFLAQNDVAGLASVCALFRLDPNINRALAARESNKAYSICGLSHTMSSLQVMGTVANAISQPLQSWDAIVCPSKAIRSVVEALWEAASQGAHRPPAKLPVIPLGINVKDFASVVNPDKRAAQRSTLGVGDNDTVILAYGRLSYHNKSHPLPILLAAETVARKRLEAGERGKLHLAFFGYFTTNTFKEDYTKFAHSICKITNVIFIENHDPRFPDKLWAGSDIFVSLVDNIQESFGLTPIEAMACGLPVLVSDWDGYRDTVRNGVDGFLVPTLSPPPACGRNLVRRYLAGEDVYGEFLAGTSQSIAVDVNTTTEYLERLVANPGLRRQMGSAAQKRACSTYDWPVIISAYEALWQELAEIRNTSNSVPAVVEHAITGPTELDPYLVFRDFPTYRLSEKDRLILADQAATILGQRLQHRMNMFIPIHLIKPNELPRLLVLINRTLNIGEILSEWPGESHSQLLLTLVWLTKMGVARYHPATGKIT